MDCEIEEAPDRSIIVEGLQQQGDRSLARKHVAQKADKWNLIQIQTQLCCVSEKDRQAGVDWFFFFFSISPPAVPGFQTTDIPNIWMLTQQLQNEWHTLLYKWNQVNLLCCFSHSYRRLATKLISAILFCILEYKIVQKPTKWVQNINYIHTVKKIYCYVIIICYICYFCT